MISSTLPNELQVKSRRRSRPAAEPPLPPATPPYGSRASPLHASRRELTPISRHVGRLALTMASLSAWQARPPLNARLAPSPVPLPRRRRSARPLRPLAGGHPLLSRQDRCADRIGDPPASTLLHQYLLRSTAIEPLHEARRRWKCHGDRSKRASPLLSSRRRLAQTPSRPGSRLYGVPHTHTRPYRS